MIFFFPLIHFFFFCCLLHLQVLNYSTVHRKKKKKVSLCIWISLIVHPSLQLFVQTNQQKAQPQHAFYVVLFAPFANVTCLGTTIMYGTVQKQGVTPPCRHSPEAHFSSPPTIKRSFRFSTPLVIPAASLCKFDEE